MMLRKFVPELNVDIFPMAESPNDSKSVVCCFLPDFLAPYL